MEATTPAIVSRDFTRQLWNETAAPGLEGRLATQYALANGYLGIRGTHEEMPGWASPGFYVAGSYCAAPAALIPIHAPEHILSHPQRVQPERHAAYTELTTMPNLPNPIAVRLTIGEERIELATVQILSCERLLEMTDACLTRRLVIRDGAGRRTIIDSERFASWDNPHLAAFRYRVTADGHDAPLHVEAVIHTAVSNAHNLRLFEVMEERRTPGLNQVSVRLAQPEQYLSIAQASCVHRDGSTVVLDVAVGVQEHATHAEETATRALATGYAALRAAHLAAVREAESRGHAEINADGLTEQGFRFGLLHLDMALCRDNPRVSIPIKGLSGEGYRFMVFWDTDFHMFPYYLLTNPRQAKHLIHYRYLLLDAARRNARAWGYPGAQVPWETGSSGEEETAPWLCLQERELHVSADAAYMVKQYDDLTGDASVLIDYGAELVFETARFFAGRVTWNADAQRYELRDIGCPDQYHTFADNNVFISRMAKWNLAYAAELAGDVRLRSVREKIGLGDDEAAAFRAIAAQLYLIAPNADGIIEEFDGFFALSTDLRGISESYCAHTQAVKQPDVLLLFHPFAEEYSAEIMQRNWHFYAARTLHGSSLSLPGMALAATKAGLLDEALPYFQRAARMDLDDINLNTNLGVHLAGYAVLWQTVVFGFGGLTPRRDGLHFRPRLPRQWDRLAFTAHWHGNRLLAELTHDGLRLTAAAENAEGVPVCVDGASHLIAPGEVW